MNTLTTFLTIAFAVLVHADSKLETLGGVSTTKHEVSPLAVRPREAIIEGREPTRDEQSRLLNTYRLRWTVTFPDRRPDGEQGVSKILTLRVWDRMFKQFPGSNSPFVEIFSDDVRLSCQELSEVGWAVEVSAASHRETFLYVLTKHRHRIAYGDNMYEFNPQTLKFDFKGIHFSKEELERENQELKERGLR